MAGKPEPVPEGSRQQARAGGGAHQREGRQFEGNRRGTGPLAHHDVHPEILHGHVQHLFGRPGHPVDLVKEQDFALGKGGKDGSEVPRVLDGRAAADPQGRVHFGRNDHGEGCLAQTRRAGEEYVVRAAPAHPGSLEHQGQLFPHPVLADEVVQVLGPEGRLDGPFLRLLPRGHQ